MHWILVFAGLSGACAVAMGAGAAHGFSSALPPQNIAWIKTAADYQIWHSLLLVAVAAFAERLPKLKWAALLTALGILLFSGSLYILAFTDLKAVAALTPFGGALLIAAWGMVAWAGTRAAIDRQSEAA